MDFLVLLMSIVNDVKEIFDVKDSLPKIHYAYSCFNIDFHKSTSIYNISYNGKKLDDMPIHANDCFVETWKNHTKDKKENLNENPHVIWGSLSIAFLAFLYEFRLVSLFSVSFFVTGVVLEKES